MKYLTQEQLNDYRQNGIVIIENVFTEEQVANFREQFHDQLNNIGFNHEKLLNGEHKPDSNVRMKSDIANIFYSKWKMDIHLNDKVCGLMEDLLLNTYGKGSNPKDLNYDELFSHPFGDFNAINAYIDRVCYRLPDHIRTENGLKMHLDRRPYRIDLNQIKKNNKKKAYKWRPIQSFVALTDHYGGESGGLKIVNGFHKKFNDYFKDKINLDDIDTGGEFYRMNTGHEKLIKECQPVIVPAGSLVCWDYRLPHSTCDKLIGYDSREVVYTGFIPQIKLNSKYILDQMQSISNNKPPPAYDNGNDKKCDKDPNYNPFEIGLESSYLTLPHNK
jgi:hypothetical protein